MAIGMGEPKEKVRAMMIEVCDLVRLLLSCATAEFCPQKMIQPVGKPPEVGYRLSIVTVGMFLDVF